MAKPHQNITKGLVMETHAQIKTSNNKVVSDFIIILYNILYSKEF